MGKKIGKLKVNPERERARFSKGRQRGQVLNLECSMLNNVIKAEMGESRFKT